MIKGKRVDISRAFDSVSLSPDNRRPRSPSPRGRSPHSNDQNPVNCYSRGGTRRHYTPPPPLSPRPRGQMSPEMQRHSLDGPRTGSGASFEKSAQPCSNLPAKGQVPPSSDSQCVSPLVEWRLLGKASTVQTSTRVEKLLPSSSIPRDTPPFASQTVATRSCPRYTPGAS